MRKRWTSLEFIAIVRPFKRVRHPFFIIAGWSSPVARQAHNLKVVGSNPTPATNQNNELDKISRTSKVARYTQGILLEEVCFGIFP
jgi:hypothetical protein